MTFRRPSNDDEIVAVSFLNRRELADLGQQLSRIYPIADDDRFADLLVAIDRAELSGAGKARH